MKNRHILAAAAFTAAISVQLSGIGAPAEAQRSDAQIRREIVRQSIAAYPGKLPLPVQ